MGTVRPNVGTIALDFTSTFIACTTLGLSLWACGGKTTTAPGTVDVGGGGGTSGATSVSAATGGSGPVVGGTGGVHDVTVTTTGPGAMPGSAGTATATTGFGGMPNPGNGGSSGFGGTSAAGGATGVAGASSGVTYCAQPYPPPVSPTSRVISDFESGLRVQAVANGEVWSADNDGTGFSSLSNEPCGTKGNGMHFVGKGHTLWGADVATALVSATQPLDVGSAKGIRFVMTSSSPTYLIFKVQNPYSSPGCGRCDSAVSPPLGTECYSGFVKNMAVVRDITPHVVFWTDLIQQGWGFHPPEATVFDPRNLSSIAFAFDRNVDFDVCIDDIELVP